MHLSAALEQKETPRAYLDGAASPQDGGQVARLPPFPGQTFIKHDLTRIIQEFAPILLVY